MRNKPAILAIAACALLTTAGILIYNHNPEPTYNGQPLRWWVQHNYTPGYYLTPTLTLEDKKAIRSMGTKAIPYLADWSVYVRPKWAPAADWVATKTGLFAQSIAAQEARKENRAANAIAALAELRDDAALAFPALARRAANLPGTNLTNPARMCLYRLIYYHQFEEMTLNHLWGHDVPMSTLLQDALNHPDPIVRQEATRAYQSLTMGTHFTNGPAIAPPPDPTNWQTGK